MAKRPAKGQVIKVKARAKVSASKRAKKAVQTKTQPAVKTKKVVQTKTQPAVKTKKTAAAKSRAVAPAQPGRGAASAPPSTDIRRAYKSRLLAGYMGTHGADSIPGSKK